MNDPFKGTTRHSNYQLPVEPVTRRKSPFREPVATNTAATTVQNSNKQSVSVNVASLIALGQESLREARRQNQRRYRQKQHDHMVALEQETSKLQLQIKQLGQQRRIVTPVVPGGDACVWSVAVEYFRLFQLGLREQPASSGPVHARDLSSAQLSFLRSRLAQDAILNEGRGVDVAIYSWRRASFWFQDFRLELEDLHKEARTLWSPSRKPASPSLNARCATCSQVSGTTARVRLAPRW